MRNGMLFAVALLAACKHSGAGEGTLESAVTGAGTAAEGAVEFSWKTGADPSAGSIQARLPDGETFRGDFLQVTDSASVDTVGPYYRTWSTPTWGGDGPWYSGDVPGFVKVYSGRVVAHLVGSEGTRMRCNFVLRDPSRGIPGGAAGDCQMSDRKTVFDAKLRGHRG